MGRCTVTDVPTLATTGDIVESRGRYKAAYERCAEKVEAIRAHDKRAREAISNKPARK